MHGAVKVTESSHAFIAWGGQITLVNRLFDRHLLGHLLGLFHRLGHHLGLLHVLLLLRLLHVLLLGHLLVSRCHLLTWLHVGDGLLWGAIGVSVVGFVDGVGKLHLSSSALGAADDGDDTEDEADGGQSPPEPGEGVLIVVTPFLICAGARIGSSAATGFTFCIQVASRAIAEIVTAILCF